MIKEKAIARFRLCAFALILSACLTGCAATDYFSPRAADYNQETADTKSSLIMKNIIRSAYTLPLQFTDISTVTGVASVSGGIAGSVPFSTRGIPTLLGSVAPTASISDNSTFGVTNLNTQEFYNGIQSPISKQLIALYMRSGFPPRVLLPLVISNIEFTYRGKRARIVNSATDANTFRNFNSVLNTLIDDGLSTQEASSTAAVGPVLSLAQATDARLEAQLITAGADAPTLEKVGDKFQLKKQTKGASFCFDPLTFGRSGPYADQGVYLGPSRFKNATLKIPLLFADGPVPSAVVRVNQTAFCGNQEPKAAQNDRVGESKVGLDLTITTRSVEGIIHYLGDLVRTEAGLESGQPTSFLLSTTDNPKTMTQIDYRLFHAEPRAPSAGDIFTIVNGQPYSIRVDPSGHDYSSRVLQLLTDLLALESSAKNLPGPSVISVLNQ